MCAVCSPHCLRLRENILYSFVIANLRGDECQLNKHLLHILRFCHHFCHFNLSKYCQCFQSSIVYIPELDGLIGKTQGHSSFAFLVYGGNIDNYTLRNLQVTRFANYWQILCSLGSYICNSNSNCISFNFLQFPLFIFVEIVDTSRRVSSVGILYLDIESSKC